MPAMITKLPDSAEQKANLTVVNGVSQKFYQVYIVESKKQATIPTKYDVITAHGRIGHTPKYLTVATGITLADVDLNVANIIKNKKKKGYTEQKLGLNPTTLVGTATLPKAIKKPILQMPGNIMSVPVTANVAPVEKPKPKIDLRYHRIGNILD